MYMNSEKNGNGELDHAMTVMNVKWNFTKVLLSIAIYLYKCFLYL